MGHEVTREYVFKLFIIRECKGTVATLLALTVVTSGDRNILLSVSYQEHNHVPSSVGSGGEKKKASLLSEIRCNFAGDVPVLREMGIWICYISSWIFLFFFFPSYLYDFLV